LPDSPRPNPPTTSAQAQPAGSAETVPELVRLGETLRRAREAEGLSVEELAERLCLGSDQLQALESGDRSRLPEGVFVIAQARRVGAVLDVDLEGAIAQLRASEWMDRRPARPLPLGTPQPIISGGRSPSGLPRAALALLALIVALAAALGLSRFLRRPLPQPAATPPAAAPVRPPEAAPPAPAERSSSADRMVLRTRQGKPSWMEVRTAEGEVLFRGLLDGERSFPMADALEVRAGRPHALLVEVGDAPARPLGGVNDLGWRRISP
jgi:transcriptional regulator with XRE-family HTH domain